MLDTRVGDADRRGLLIKTGRAGLHAAAWVDPPIQPALSRGGAPPTFPCTVPAGQQSWPTFPPPPALVSTRPSPAPHQWLHQHNGSTNAARGRRSTPTSRSSASATARSRSSVPPPLPTVPPTARPTVWRGGAPEGLLALFGPAPPPYRSPYASPDRTVPLPTPSTARSCSSPPPPPFLPFPLPLALLYGGGEHLKACSRSSVPPIPAAAGA